MTEQHSVAMAPSSKVETNLVFVITQYVRDVRLVPVSLCFYTTVQESSKKVPHKFVDVGKTTFCIAKTTMRYVDAAIIGGICCICHIYRTNPIGAAASGIRKDLVA